MYLSLESNEQTLSNKNNMATNMVNDDNGRISFCNEITRIERFKKKKLIDDRAKRIEEHKIRSEIMQNQNLSCQQAEQNQHQCRHEQQSHNELSPPSTPLHRSNINTLSEDENSYISQSLEQLKRLESERQETQGHNKSVNKETLIEEIRKHPIIWSLKHKDYKDNNKKRIAWQMIFKTFEEQYGIDELRNTWKNVRDGYVRCKAKREKLIRSGSKAARLPTCNYYNELEFLLDNSEHTSTSTTNISDKMFQSPTNESHNRHETSSEQSIQVTSNYRESFNIRKRKNQENMDEVDKKMLSFEAYDNRIKDVLTKLNEKEEQPNELFCRSLISIMDSLTPEQNMLARIKIQQILFDIKYNDK